MDIKIKKLNDTAILPTRGSDGAAGYDLYANITEDIEIHPYKSVMIGTGLSFELPKGYFAGIYARSGLATKRGLRPSNCVGICDEDYRGEYKISLYNDSNEFQIIHPNDRIAQVIFQKYEEVNFVEDELSITSRGDGGFGHSGENV